MNRRAEGSRSANSSKRAAPSAPKPAYDPDSLYRTLARNFPNGAVYLFDSDLRFLLAEGAGLQAAVSPRGDIEGRTIRDVFPPSAADEIEQACRGALDGQTSLLDVAYADRRYELRVVPVRNDRGDIFGGMAMTQDITERKQHQDRVRQQFEKLLAVRAIGTAITASLDLRTVLNILLDQVTSLLEIDAADILLFDQRMQALEFAAERGWTEPQAETLRGLLSKDPSAHAALAGETVTLCDLQRRGATERLATLANLDITDYLAVPLVANSQVQGVLELYDRKPLLSSAEWIDLVRMLAEQAALAIYHAYLFDQLHSTNAKLTAAYDATLEGWSRALDLRDKETEGHSRRVTEMTLRLAREMGTTEEDLLHVRRGALLHDIGKLGIPDSILQKVGPLTDREWDIMRKHPKYAYDMLAPIVFLRPALEIPYSHHEKWDGTGYPRGLSGGAIPIAARIFAVADVWDALRSDRPYRKGWAASRVRDHIRSLSGTHFDPAVVEVFLRIVADESDNPTALLEAA